MLARMASLLLLARLLCAAASDPAAPGWEHIYNLEYDAATAEFSKALAAHPDNLNLRNNIAQSIMFGLMLRSGALESELVTGNNPFQRRAKMEPTAAEQRSFREQVESVLHIAARRIAANPHDIQAHYAQGVAYGLRANYNFLVRKAYWDSLRDATNARKSHDRVVALDRANVDARLVQGVHEYIVANLPFAYRMAGILIGFHGDRENGIRILRMVARQGNLTRVDAEIMLAAIYRRERRPAEAIPLLEDLIRRYPRNYIFRFELAQMYSDAIDKNNALRVIREIEELKRTGKPGYDQLPPEKIYYARGVVQFWYRDFDESVENLKRVVEHSAELDLNTAAMARLRLGQCYDMLGRRPLAVAAYQSTIAFAPDSEQAKESRGYLASPFRRKD